MKPAKVCEHFTVQLKVVRKMIDDESPVSGWTEKETQKFYAFLGQYIIIFQEIESKIEMCLQHCWGLENWSENFDRLIKMKNFQKIDQLEKAVFESNIPEIAAKKEGWLDEFVEAINRSRCVAETRNSLVHSKYEWRGSEHGLPPMKSDFRKVCGEFVERHQEITDDLMAKNLQEVTYLALFISAIERQLSHFVSALERSEKA